MITGIGMIARMNTITRIKNMMITRKNVGFGYFIVIYCRQRSRATRT
jgi:hypothetical protein